MQCATDTQMMTRTSWLFTSNVYMNNFIAILTLVLTFKVVKRLHKRTIFSSSTHVLIWISLCIVNLHQIIYGYIQNWSLYRSIVYSSDPCKIMFSEYECFPFYTANIFSRLLLLFTNCAVTIDRLLTLLVPVIRSSFLRGVFLFLLSLFSSVVFCLKITSDGPNDNLQSNCYQRLNRNLDELREQVLFYFYVCAVCLSLNLLAWLFDWRSVRSKKYNLREQYSKRESVNSAIVISLILLFQVIALGFYSLSVVYIVDIYEVIDHTVLTNLILWFYTYPWASLSLPAGILLSTRFISLKRRQRIGALTTENKNESQMSYFIKLNQSWGTTLTVGRR